MSIFKVKCEKCGWKGDATEMSLYIDGVNELKQDIYLECPGKACLGEVKI